MIAIDAKTKKRVERIASYLLGAAVSQTILSLAFIRLGEVRQGADRKTVRGRIDNALDLISKPAAEA